MSQEVEESAVEGESKPKKKPKFIFKTRHDVLMLQQVLTENPYQTRKSREFNVIWENISVALQSEGIDAQGRSMKLRTEHLLALYERGEKKPHPAGNEEEYAEFDRLLGEVSELRKEEKEKAYEAAKIGLSAKPTPKKSVKLADDSRKRTLEGFAVRDTGLSTAAPSVKVAKDVGEDVSSSESHSEVAFVDRTSESKTDQSRSDVSLPEPKRFKNESSAAAKKAQDFEERKLRFLEQEFQLKREQLDLDKARHELEKSNAAARIAQVTQIMGLLEKALSTVVELVLI